MKLLPTDVLKTIDDGGALEELGRKLRETAAAVDDLGGEGSVTLKLKFRKLAPHQLTVTPEVSNATPRRKSDPSVFFVDPDGDLTRSNPNQYSLLTGAKTEEEEETTP